MKNGDRFFVLNWEEAFSAGIPSAGSKGWNLARLVRYGFPVPAGGVLDAEAYREFVRHNGLEDALRALAGQMDRLDPADARCAALSEEAAGLIRAAEVPPALLEELDHRLREWGLSGVPLAVRSSAAEEDSPGASFAGIHDSSLNVRGREALPAAVKRCWASSWGPRAAAYRRGMGLPCEPAAPAVVVMAMADAAASGVAFSCHPGSGREDQVFISANFGLGESVVGGSVDPDEYTVHVGFHSQVHSVESKKIGRKEKASVPAEGGGTALLASPGRGSTQALSDDHILRLARLVRRVYWALGNAERHQDVEWVFDGKGFYLVQSRPVTAVPRYTYRELKDQPTIWSNANFRDTMPMAIPPLSWSNMADTLDVVLRSVMSAAGYRPLPGLSRKKLVNGRGYFNISVLQWENHDAFGSPPRKTNAYIGGHQPAIRLPEREPVARRLGRLGRNLALMRAARRVGRGIDERFRQMAARIQAAGSRDLTGVDDAGLLAVWADAEKAIRDARDIHFALIGSAASYLVMIEFLERFFPGRGEALGNALLAGRETTTSAEHGYRLHDLARTAAGDPDALAFLGDGGADPRSWERALPEESAFRKEFSAFLEEFGHRGIFEWDIRNPRWREDPSWLLEVVRGNLVGLESGAVERLRLRQRDTAERAWREVVSGIPFFWRPFVRKLAGGAGRETAQREMARSTIARTVDLSRRVALEVGRRLVLRGALKDADDVFFLAWEEIRAIATGEGAAGRGISDLVSDRRARHGRLEKLTPPDYFEEDLPRRAPAAGESAGDALTGMGVSPGRAAGPARLVHQPSEGRRLLQGDVLVAPGTDPAWTPLFLRASALVMETGGIISHGAIVAREYGIPAVVNVPGVLEVLADGRRVVVDGDAGKVHLE